MSESISVVALVVSLVALTIALLQVIQQYASTAEGFRRCRRSVIGNWYDYTHRHFRLREFRLETRFSTPHFQMLEKKFEKRPERESDRTVFLPHEGPPYLPAWDTKDDTINAKVSWLTLLWELADLEIMLEHRSDRLVAVGAEEAEVLSYPALSIQERSWDFMP